MKAITMTSVVFSTLALLIFAIMIPVVITAIDWGVDGIHNATNTTVNETTPYDATMSVFQLLPLVIVGMILIGIVATKDEVGL